MINFSVIIGGIASPSNGKLLIFSSDINNHSPFTGSFYQLVENSIQNCNAFDSHLSERDVIQSSSIWNFSLSHVLTLKEQDKLEGIFSPLGANLTTTRLKTLSLFANSTTFTTQSGISTGLYHIGTECVNIGTVAAEGNDVICSNVTRGQLMTRPKHHGSLGSYGMPITTTPLFWVGRDVYIYINQKLFRQGVLAENPNVTANEISFSVSFSDSLLNSDLLGTRQENICRLSDYHYYKEQTKQPYIIKKLASNPLTVIYNQKDNNFACDTNISRDIAASEILTLNANEDLPKDYYTNTGVFTSDRQQWWTGVSDVGNYTASFHFVLDPKSYSLSWDAYYSETEIINLTTVMAGFSLFWAAPSITLTGADIQKNSRIKLVDVIDSYINLFGERTSIVGPNYRDFVLRFDNLYGFNFLSTFTNVADPWVEIGLITQENTPNNTSNEYGFVGHGNWSSRISNDQLLIEESKSVISDIPLNWKDSNDFLFTEMNLPQTISYLQPFQGGVGTLNSENFVSPFDEWEEDAILYSKNVTNQQTLPKLEIYPWRLLSVPSQVERKWYSFGYIGSESYGNNKTTESIHWFKAPTIRSFTGNEPNYTMNGFEQNVRLLIPLVHADKWVNDFEFYLLSNDLTQYVLNESDVIVRWQEMMNTGQFEQKEQKIHVKNDASLLGVADFFSIRNRITRHIDTSYLSFGEWTTQGGNPVSLIPILPIVNALNNDVLNEVLCSVDGSGSNLLDQMVQGFGIDLNNIDRDSFNSFCSDWLKNYDLDKLRQEGFAALEGLLHLSSLCIRSISQNGYQLQLASLATPTYNQVKCEFNDDNILTFPTNITQLPVVSKYSVIGMRNNNKININIIDGLALACMGTGEDLSLDLTLGELLDNIQDNESLRSKLFACHQRYGEPHKTISFSVALDANPYFLYLSCGDVIYLNSEILQNKLNLSPCLGQITSVKIDLLKKQATVNILLWSQTVTGWNPSFKFTQSGTRVELTGAERVWDFLPTSVSVSVFYNSTSTTDTYTKSNERGVYTSNNSRTQTGYVIFPDQTGFFVFNDIIV